MRIIESQMSAAINREVDWKLDNTQVVNIQGISFVYLHDNLIAMVGETWMQLFDGGYRSKTTKSRLNAILRGHGNAGEYIFQKDFKWFLKTQDGESPFVDGVELR